MIDLTNFNAKLDKLTDALKQSGNQTLSFFESLKIKFQAVQSEEDLKNAMVEISKIGAIAQYGDLSPKEDTLLTDVLQEADSLSAEVK